MQPGWHEDPALPTLVHCGGPDGPAPRVLHISPLPPPWGGVASNLMSLLTANELSHFRMAVVNTARRREREDVNPSKRLWHLHRWTHALRIFRDTRKALAHFRPDIVHIQSAGTDVSALRDMMLIGTAARRGCRVVFHQHFWADPSRISAPKRLFEFIYRRYIPRATTVLMSTPVHIEQASKLVDVANAVYFPNTCNVPAVLPARSGGEKRQIVYVGRLSELKGTYDLIEAIALLRPSDPAWRFVLIGVGATAEDDARIADRIARHGIADRVVLTGRVSDEEKWRILSESDLMVFPTHSELFPVTLIEALAAGLPIVTTAVDYLPQLVVNGENGSVVPPRQPADLARAISALRDDRELRAAMGKRNRAKFEKEFSVAVVAGSLRRIYEGMLAA